MTAACPIEIREDELKAARQTRTDEDGYMAILATMMILALLTIIGAAASRTANTEVLMAGHEIRYQRNFYRAEGAAMEAADILHHATGLADKLPAWIDPVVGNLTIERLREYWDNDASRGDAVIPAAAQLDKDHTLFVAATEGIAPGGSLGMDTPTVHALAIYGRCQWDGVAIVKVGYLVAY